MKISAIRVGTRHRRDLGDISGLADSIRAIGLLHPVVVSARGDLIAGERRLAALKQLGWSDVPVTVAESLDQVRTMLVAERDENICRKDFAPSEAVAVGRAIEVLERPAAQKRQEEGRKAGGRGKKKLGGKLPPSNGRTRERVAEAVGLSGRTYQKAMAVVEAASAEPEKYADLQKKMDDTGKIEPVHKELQKRRCAEFGPTPQEAVRSDPEIRWLKIMTEVSRAVYSIRDLGGIETLTKLWRPETKVEALDELRDIGSQIQGWIKHLENSNGKARRTSAT